jgi:hypothetical protein
MNVDLEHFAPTITFAAASDGHEPARVEPRGTLEQALLVEGRELVKPSRPCKAQAKVRAAISFPMGKPVDKDDVKDGQILGATIYLLMYSHLGARVLRFSFYI